MPSRRSSLKLVVGLADDGAGETEGPDLDRVTDRQPRLSAGRLCLPPPYARTEQALYVGDLASRVLDDAKRRWLFAECGPLCGGLGLLELRLNTASLFLKLVSYVFDDLGLRYLQVRELGFEFAGQLDSLQLGRLGLLKLHTGAVALLLYPGQEHLRLAVLRVLEFLGSVDDALVEPDLLGDRHRVATSRQAHGHAVGRLKRHGVELDTPSR